MACKKQYQKQNLDLIKTNTLLLMKIRELESKTLLLQDELMQSHFQMTQLKQHCDSHKNELMEGCDLIHFIADFLMISCGESPTVNYAKHYQNKFKKRGFKSALETILDEEIVTNENMEIKNETIKNETIKNQFLT